MARVTHVIGNGDWAGLFQRESRKGLKIACNQTPFEIPDKWCTAIVDFKFMAAMTRREISVPGQWLLGFRPKKWMEDHPMFYMSHAQQVKEFYTALPKYAVPPDGNIGLGYTNFNCGHMAVHYCANKLKADEVHMYGFDSIFDFNLRSFSDLVLTSDRGNTNTNRLAHFWRPIWTEMWKEFPNTKFILHHIHDAFKVEHGDNVEARVYEKKPVIKPKPILTPDGRPNMNVSEA